MLFVLFVCSAYTTQLTYFIRAILKSVYAFRNAIGADDRGVAIALFILIPLAVVRAVVVFQSRLDNREVKEVKSLLSWIKYPYEFMFESVIILSLSHNVPTWLAVIFYLTAASAPCGFLSIAAAPEMDAKSLKFWGAFMLLIKFILACIKGFHPPSTFYVPSTPHWDFSLYVPLNFLLELLFGLFELALWALVHFGLPSVSLSGSSVYVSLNN